MSERVWQARSASSRGASRAWLVIALAVLSVVGLQWLLFRTVVRDIPRWKRAQAGLSDVWQRMPKAKGQPSSRVTEAEVEQYIRLRKRLAPALSDIERVLDARCARATHDPEGLVRGLLTGALQRYAAQEADDAESLLQSYEQVRAILVEEDISPVQLGKCAVVIDWRFLHRPELAHLAVRDSQRPALWEISARCRHLGSAPDCERLLAVAGREADVVSADDPLLERYRAELEALPTDALGVLVSVRSPQLLEWCPPPQSMRASAAGASHSR